MRAWPLRLSLPAVIVSGRDPRGWRLQLPASLRSAGIAPLSRHAPTYALLMWLHHHTRKPPQAPSASALSPTGPRAAGTPPSCAWCVRRGRESTPATLRVGAWLELCSVRRSIIGMIQYWQRVIPALNLLPLRPRQVRCHGLAQLPRSPTHVPTGYTALAHATGHHPQLELAKVLLEFGANPSQPTR